MQQCARFSLLSPTQLKGFVQSPCVCDRPRLDRSCSLRAAEKTEESVSLLEKVLGHADAHAEEVKARAKVRAARRVVMVVDVVASRV